MVSTGLGAVGPDECKQRQQQRRGVRVVCAEDFPHRQMGARLRLPVCPTFAVHSARNPQDPIPNPSGRTFVLREPIALTARPPHTCNCDRPWSHPSVGLVRIRGLTLTQVVFGSFPPFLTSKVNLRHFTFRLPHAPASEMQKNELVSRVLSRARDPDVFTDEGLL